MTREELKRHCEATCKMFGNGRTTTRTYMEHRLVLDLLEQTEWIPVNERVPEAGEYIGDVAKYYLVQNKYGDMLVARYTHGEYWEQIYTLKPIGDEIVAWMPLPAPYEPQEEKE